MGWPRTCLVVDIVKVTQQGAAPVLCKCRYGSTRWGAHWRDLAITIEPSTCGDDAAFLLNYFDHLLVAVLNVNCRQCFDTVGWSLGIASENGSVYEVCLSSSSQC